MANSRSRFWLVPLAVLICVLVGAQTLESQCPVTSTTTDMPGTMITIVSKYLSLPYLCTSIPAQMNAVDCNPGVAGFVTTLLTAERVTATMMAKCAWTCAGCGMVTIDGSDGLPVELMNFGFEDEEVGDTGAGETAEDAGQRASR